MPTIDTLRRFRYRRALSLAACFCLALLCLGAASNTQAQELVGWGDNRFNQASPPDIRDITQVAAGSHHNVALRSDGTVIAWGSNWTGQADVPEGLTDVVQVAAGSKHTVALRGDGTVVAWGANLEGQTDVPEGLTGVTQIAAGADFTLALKGGQTVSTTPAPSDAQALPLAIEALYPNPMSGAVTVRYAVQEAGPVALEVLDLLGRRLAVLHEGDAAPGEHTVRWTPEGVAAGVYLVRLQAGGRQEVRRVTLLAR